MTLDLPPPSPRVAAGTPGPSPLEHQLRCFKLWLEHSHDVIAEITLSGRLVDISPNVRTVLGYEPGEMTGASYLSHLHPEDAERVQAMLISPQGWGTCRYRHQDGSWRWIEASGRRIASTTGEDRIWLVARDVTGRKLAEDECRQLESQLCQTQKLELLGTLAGGIAHDFNNILAAIILTAELARIESTALPQLQHRMEQILSAGQRAKSLVQQILSFSRPQAPGRQPIMLPAVISEALSLLRTTLPATIELRADIRDSSSLVRADATQMHQVLMNLCVNAAQAMHGRSGRIDVHLDSFMLDRHSTRTVPALPAGPYVRLTVSDTGDGMDAATVQRIFDPYFTTKEKAGGTGLGLAVVKQIVKSHAGAIHVTSQPGQGTVFELLLPRHES